MRIPLFPEYLTMYHDLPATATFWAFLFTIDKDLAETARKKGCRCGGHLHCAHYPRKPRGTPEQLTEAQCVRLSFCCDRDGCRKRVTPPSVRFLGRKVYLGAVVVLVSAMRQGPSPRRVHELSERFGADPTHHRTPGRSSGSANSFPKLTSGSRHVHFCYHSSRSSVRVPYSSLVNAFVDDSDSDASWSRLLCFLAPISSPGAL